MIRFALLRTGHDNTLRNSLHAGDTPSPGEVSWSFPRSFHIISAPQASPRPQKPHLTLIRFALLRTGHDNTLRNSLHAGDTPSPGEVSWSFPRSFHIISAPQASPWPQKPHLTLIRFVLLRTGHDNTLRNSLHAGDTPSPGEVSWSFPRSFHIISAPQASPWPQKPHLTLIRFALLRTGHDNTLRNSLHAGDTPSPGEVSWSFPRSFHIISAPQASPWPQKNPLPLIRFVLLRTGHDNTLCNSLHAGDTPSLGEVSWSFPRSFHIISAPQASPWPQKDPLPLIRFVLLRTGHDNTLCNSLHAGDTPSPGEVSWSFPRSFHIISAPQASPRPQKPHLTLIRFALLRTGHDNTLRNSLHAGDTPSLGEVSWSFPRSFHIISAPQASPWPQKDPLPLIRFVLLRTGHDNTLCNSLHAGDTPSPGEVSWSFPRSFHIISAPQASPWPQKDPLPLIRFVLLRTGHDNTLCNSLHAGDTPSLGEVSWSFPRSFHIISAPQASPWPQKPHLTLIRFALLRTGHDNTLCNSLHAGDTPSPGEVSWSFPRSFHIISAPQASPWPQKDPLPLIRFVLLRTGHDNTLRNSLHAGDTPSPGEVSWSFPRSFHIISAPQASPRPQKPHLTLIRFVLLRTGHDNTLCNSLHAGDTPSPGEVSWSFPRSFHIISAPQASPRPQKPHLTLIRFALLRTGHDNTLRNSLHAGDTPSLGEVSWSFPRSFHIISAPQASPWPQKDPLPLIRFVLLRTGHDNTLCNSLHAGDTPSPGEVSWSFPRSFHIISAPQASPWPQKDPLPLIRFVLLRTGHDNTLRNSLHAGDTPSPGEVSWSFPRSFHIISAPQASPRPQKPHLTLIRFALLRTGHDNTLRNSLHAGDTPSPGEVSWSFPRSFHIISAPQASPWPQKPHLTLIRFALLRTGHDNTLRNSLHAGDTPSPGEVSWSFPRSFHTILAPQASPWPQKEPLSLIRHTLLRTSLHDTFHNSHTAAPTAWTQPELPRTFITKL